MEFNYLIKRSRSLDLGSGYFGFCLKELERKWFVSLRVDGLVGHACSSDGFGLLPTSKLFCCFHLKMFLIFFPH